MSAAKRGKVTDAEFTDVLAAELRASEAAHHVFEAETGSETPWPQFYAQHLLDTFGEDSFTYDQLLTALNAAATAHGKHEEETGERDENWPEWYAAHMTRTLYSSWNRFVATLGSLEE